MTPTITAVSFAYPAVGHARRADLATSLGRRSERPEVEAFVLSTCLRLEIAVPGDRSRLEEAAEMLLGTSPGGGEVRTGADAVHHLLRVAAGLESPVIGELEVWTQFRRALADAKATGLDGHFGKVLEHSVNVGRQARDLLPSSPHGSLASVASVAVGDVDRVAVLGGGQMALTAAAALLARPVTPSVTVVARTPAKVDIQGVDVWPFDRAPEALSTFPAVVSATSAKRRLVADDELAALLAGRSQPLTLVDLAMPPDLSPPADGSVTYVNIDDLAAMVADRVDTDAADRLVAGAAEQSWRRFAGQRDVGPVIGRLYSNADEVVERTVERFAGRLSDPGDVAVLRQAARTVARTLLAGPVGHMSRSEEPNGMAKALAAAFGLDGDTVDG